MAIHSVLPEVYIPLADLDIFIYLLVYLGDVYALPWFCVNLWGMDIYGLSPVFYHLLANLCIHVELCQFSIDLTAPMNSNSSNRATLYCLLPLCCLHCIMSDLHSTDLDSCL